MPKSNYGFTLRSDGRYQGYWRELVNGEPVGKRHCICDKDPKKLQKRIRELEKPKSLSFAVVADEWSSEYIEKANPRTWKNYKHIYDELVSEFGNKPIGEISGLDVDRVLKRAQAQRYSHTVVNEYRVVMNHILNHAFVKGYIVYNPVLGIKIPKAPKGKRRSVTDEEIKTIINSINQPFGFFPFFVLCTGMRKGEALALVRSDIDLDKREISITKALYYPNDSKPVVKPPKSAAGVRVIPIVEPLYKPLLAYLKKNKSHYLFPHIAYKGEKRDAYMAKYNYDVSWNRYCKAVGFWDGKPTIGAHNLRHGTATLFFEADVDPKTAQKVLGHSSLSVTMGIYTELREQKEKSSIDKFGTVMANLIAKSSK